MGELIQLTSKIDPKFNIFIVTPEDEEYEQFKEVFKTHGLAYTDLNSKIIIIDGEALDRQKYDSMELLHFIISHEIAHHKLKHRGEYNKRQEAEADLLGIKLCQKYNYNASAKIGIKEFKNRNGISLEAAEELYGNRLLGLI